MTDSVTLPLGRLRLRLHLLLPVVAGLLWAISPPLGPRYLLLLTSLALHELGHALASLALGGRAAEVILLPVFGWARVERFQGGREAAVAVAGPAVNLLAAAGLSLTGASFTLRLGGAPAADFLLTVNLLMGACNLLPVAPLDGGRILAFLRRA